MTRLFALPFRWFALLVCALSVAGATFGPTHVKGSWQTTTGNQDRRPYDWRKEIEYLDPERFRFTQIFSKLPDHPVESVEFKIFEREHPSRWTRINNGAGYSSSATSIVVDDGSMFRDQDLVLVPRTNERWLVTGISSNTLTVTRAQQGTSGVAVNDNDWIKILYSKEEENGRSPDIVTTDFSTQTNWAQTFKRAYGLSNDEKKETKRGPKTLAEERKIAEGLIKEDIEQAILWGRMQELSANGETVRYTGGIDQFVTTNRIDMEGGIGYGDIGYLMNVATRYGGSKKIWVCGRDARQRLDAVGYPFLQIGPKENKLGMAVEGFRTSFGECMLLTHHGLTNAHAGHLFIIDPAHMAWGTWEAMKHETDLQENDRDGVKNQFIAKGGLWMDTEKAHVVVTGLTNKVV